MPCQSGRSTLRPTLYFANINRSPAEYQLGTVFLCWVELRAGDLLVRQRQGAVGRSRWARADTVQRRFSAPRTSGRRGKRRRRQQAPFPLVEQPPLVERKPNPPQPVSDLLQPAPTRVRCELRPFITVDSVLLLGQTTGGMGTGCYTNRGMLGRGYTNLPLTTVGGEQPAQSTDLGLGGTAVWSTRSHDLLPAFHQQRFRARVPVSTGRRHDGDQGRQRDTVAGK